MADSRRRGDTASLQNGSSPSSGPGPTVTYQSWQTDGMPSDSGDLVSFQYALIGREINERMETYSAFGQDALAEEQQTKSFVCECEDPDCESLIRLTAGQYRGIRGNPNAFVLVRGHSFHHSHKVLHREDNWMVVERPPSRQAAMGGWFRAPDFS